MRPQSVKGDPMGKVANPAGRTQEKMPARGLPSGAFGYFAYGWTVSTVKFLSVSIRATRFASAERKRR